ncbi:acireductone dioxygenase [Pseudomonas sp. 15FMM2]|uniref:Acireductone dioxygenase n=1 Tax=Pseudomonas imrae TaxID=2992837 RepID=A0ACC7PIX8_9PSED
MSYVAVYGVASPDTPNKVLTHVEDIASTLAALGVRFERWQPATALDKGASEAELIAAYQSQIKALGYADVELSSVTCDHPHKAQLRTQNLVEHCYSEDHVRLVIAGQGLFTLHLDDYVYAVRCERNDLLVIPAGTPHWFDIGQNPHFMTLRMFNTRQGTVPSVTGEPIAAVFPGLDD